MLSVYLSHHLDLLLLPELAVVRGAESDDAHREHGDQRAHAHRDDGEDGPVPRPALLRPRHQLGRPQLRRVGVAREVGGPRLHAPHRAQHRARVHHRQLQQGGVRFAICMLPLSLMIKLKASKTVICKKKIFLSLK